MSVIGHTRRFTTLLVVLILSMIFGCTSNKFLADRCQRGHTYRSNNPKICVDPANLSANPDHAIVWDVEKDSNGEPSNRPIWIIWEAKSGSRLGIEFKEKGCVTNVRCNGPICTAQVENTNASADVRRYKPADPKSVIKECKYELNLDGTVIDPDLEINPCCW